MWTGYGVTYHSNNGAGRVISRHKFFRERPFINEAEMRSWAVSQGIGGSIKLINDGKLVMRTEIP
jgi:hypothetical protein